MDSAERRKLNRLLRKPTPSLTRLGNSSKQRLSHRTSQTLNRLPGGGTSDDHEDTKEHGFSVDMAKLCGEMCGISNLSVSAAIVLQKHLNQIARLIIHNVIRVMEQNRRGVPQAADVDLAAVLIGLEAPLGTSPATFLPIRTGGRTATSGPGGKVFFIRPDKEIDVKALLLREPAGVVYDISLVAHWLSINGKQPVTPQNPPPDFLARMSLLNGSAGGRRVDIAKVDGVATTNLTSSEDRCQNRLSYSLATLAKPKGELAAVSLSHPRTISSVTVERRPHQASQEVMIYFRELTEACVGASENRRHEALENATLDPGLQCILPHLVTFIAEGVRVNVTNHNLAILIYLMRLVKALVDNPHISLEPYLHLLVPTVATCVLNRQLCAKPITDNHWALRDFAAKQLVTLCNRHNTSTNELYTRVTRELSKALHTWIDVASVDPSVSADSKLSDSSKPHHQSLENETDGSVDKRSPSLGTALHSMNTLYGILVSLAEFGAQTLRILVFPVLPSLCHRLTTLIEPTDTGDPVSGFSASQQRLPPADQRSFEFLKVMMTNRIAPLLSDWRTRQNLGNSLEDYRSTYECLATSLHGAARTTSTTPAGTVTTTAVCVTRTTLAENTPRLSLVSNSSVSLVTATKLEECTKLPVSTSILVDRPIHLVPITR